MMIIIFGVIYIHVYLVLKEMGGVTLYIYLLR